MMRVFSSQQPGEAILVCDALREDGIEAIVTNPAPADVPAFHPPAEVWISNPSHAPPAKTIVRTALARIDSAAADAPWRCAPSGEENPASFEVCWSCAAAR